MVVTAIEMSHGLVGWFFFFIHQKQCFSNTKINKLFALYDIKKYQTVTLAQISKPSNNTKVFFFNHLYRLTKKAFYTVQNSSNLPNIANCMFIFQNSIIITNSKRNCDFL